MKTKRVKTKRVKKANIDLRQFGFESFETPFGVIWFKKPLSQWFEKPLMKPITSRFNLAGVQYSDYQLYDEYKPDTKLDLTWERSNRFDANAIAVRYQGIRIGYVPKGPHQDIIHEYRRKGLKMVTRLTAYNPTNPTWNMFTVEVCSAERPADTANDVPI